METNVKTQWTVRWIAVLMFSLVWLGAYSQTTTATLSGVVHDSTGAVDGGRLLPDRSHAEDRAGE